MKTIYFAMMFCSAVMFTSCRSSIGSVDGHEYVDLALPSGTLWATCNVGAETPEESGVHFAWGEILPKSMYDWQTYKYGHDVDKMTKYCSISSFGNEGFVDALNVLQPSDDAAAVHWGEHWRMPTIEQWSELLKTDLCTWTWVDESTGRVGFVVTSKKNGQSIFLPAAGLCRGNGLYNDGDYGYYWSSSLDTNIPNDAWRLDFYSDHMCENNYGRHFGRSVRPVVAQ
jgi:hypothetical protein